MKPCQNPNKLVLFLISMHIIFLFIVFLYIKLIRLPDRFSAYQKITFGDCTVFIFRNYKELNSKKPRSFILLYKSVFITKANQKNGELIHLCVGVGSKLSKLRRVWLHQESRSVCRRESVYVPYGRLTRGAPLSGDVVVVDLSRGPWLI